MIKQRSPKFKSSFAIDEKGMFDLACSLISKKTINPPGDEYLVKDIVVKSMKELGMKVKIIGNKKRPNILGEIGNGYPSIAILCHMDVVPPGRDWKTDPFKPTIKNGRLYGRGACDDKGPYAASWAAIKAVLKKGKLKGKIILGAVADEEKGSEKGIKLLLKKRKLNCDFCFIPDGGKMHEAVIGEKGMLWLKIASIGKSAHGSNPPKGINAITNMFEFLPNVTKLKINTPLEVRTKGAAVPTSRRDLLLTGFTPITINLGEIKGGDAPNIVPSYCESTIDIRYPLGIKKKEIIKKIKLLINSFNRKNKGNNISLKEIFQDTSPHLLNINKNPFLKTFLEASEEVGEDLPAPTLRRSKQARMKFVTIGGNSVGKLLYFAGIPSFSHSPEDIPAAHQANESVSLKNLKKCAILWAKFLEKMIL